MDGIEISGIKTNLIRVLNEREQSPDKLQISITRSVKPNGNDIQLINIVLSTRITADGEDETNRKFLIEHTITANASLKNKNILLNDINSYVLKELYPYIRAQISGVAAIAGINLYSFPQSIEELEKL